MKKLKRWKDYYDDNAGMPQFIDACKIVMLNDIVDRQELILTRLKRLEKG